MKFNPNFSYVFCDWLDNYELTSVMKRNSIDHIRTSNAEIYWQLNEISGDKKVAVGYERSSAQGERHQPDYDELTPPTYLELKREPPASTQYIDYPKLEHRRRTNETN